MYFGPPKTLARVRSAVAERELGDRAADAPLDPLGAVRDLRFAVALAALRRRTRHRPPSGRPRSGGGRRRPGPHPGSAGPFARPRVRRSPRAGCGSAERRRRVGALGDHGRALEGEADLLIAAAASWTDAVLRRPPESSERSRRGRFSSSPSTSGARTRSDSSRSSGRFRPFEDDDRVGLHGGPSLPAHPTTGESPVPGNRPSKARGGSRCGRGHVRSSEQGLSRRHASRRRHVPRHRGRRSSWSSSGRPAAGNNGPAHGRGSRGDLGGRARDRRPRGQPRAAEGPRTSRWSSRARSTRIDGLREHRLRPAGEESAEERHRPAGARGGQHARARAPRPQAAGALGRAAPAVAMGRAIVRQPPGVPHGRAAVEPRREAPGSGQGGDRPPRRRPRVRRSTSRTTRSRR